MIDFWIFLAYVIGMAIWLRLLVFLNHKFGDIFGLDGVDCGTYLRVFFYCRVLALCRPWYLYSCRIILVLWEPRGGSRWLTTPTP